MRALFHYEADYIAFGCWRLFNVQLQDVLILQLCKQDLKSFGLRMATLLSLQEGHEDADMQWHSGYII